MSKYSDDLRPLARVGSADVWSEGTANQGRVAKVVVAGRGPAVPPSVIINTMGTKLYLISVLELENLLTY